MAEKFRDAPPRASAMIEALRGLGYSPATALADLIDNSVSAHARQVEIRFLWAGADSSVSILDDGDGMNADQLDRAMRLGDRSPLETRSDQDLGRFGLGLKTASFSQCRRLTVASRRDGVSSCLRWDLDVLAAARDSVWRLLEGCAPGCEQLLEPLNAKPHGTLVLWQVLDRLIGPGSREQDFLDMIDVVERHLAMVFHRFLKGSRPKLNLLINGRRVLPWDPFLSDHEATWKSLPDTVSVDGSPMTVQAFVLPHRDRLDPRTYELAQGPDGWTAQQGFYVYRNERLLVAGSWLGLGRGRSWTKEEPFRLARIRLDISNSADADWKIDIRKSTARPPASARPRLLKLAEDTRERARRVFAHRGKIAGAKHGPVAQAWRVDRLKAGMRYRIDRSHPAVAAVLEDAGDLQSQIIAMLRVIEETVPVQRIWLDTAESRETPLNGFTSDPPEEVTTVLQVMFSNLIHRRGLTAAAARERLLRTEPFQAYPSLVAALEDDDAAPAESAR